MDRKVNLKTSNRTLSIFSIVSNNYIYNNNINNIIIWNWPIHQWFRYENSWSHVYPWNSYSFILGTVLTLSDLKHFWHFHIWSSPDTFRFWHFPASSVAEWRFLLYKVISIKGTKCASLSTTRSVRILVLYAELFL